MALKFFFHSKHSVRCDVVRETSNERPYGHYSDLMKFQPTGNTVILHISNEDLYNIVYISIVDWYKSQTKTVQETILVDVCDEDKDRYRFGFNGQEKVNEWAGIGNFNEFSERGQDARTGRFITYDPLAKEYPWNSPYAFAENDVIRSVDIEGLEKYEVNGNNITIYAVFGIFTERPSKLINEKQYDGGNIPTSIDVHNIAKQAYAELNQKTAENTYYMDIQYNKDGSVNKVSQGSTPYKVSFNVEFISFKDEADMRASQTYKNARTDKSFAGTMLFGNDSYTDFASTPGVYRSLQITANSGATHFGRSQKSSPDNAILVSPSNYPDKVTYVHEPGHDFGLSHTGKDAGIGLQDELKGERRGANGQIYNGQGMMGSKNTVEAPMETQVVNMLNSMEGSKK